MKILFGPDYPDKEFFSISSIIHFLGYTATLDPGDDFDLAMVWQNSTWVEPPAGFSRIALEKPVLNLRCRDISKNRVEKVFTEVFGYATFIDPTLHRGRAIKKPDENAARGGGVVQCPLPAREDGFIYQRFIDTEEDGAQVELRTPVILGEIPQVKIFRKAPTSGELKSRTWFSTTQVDVSEVFSTEERRLILQLAHEMGLDFGELDVLRCRESGRIYVLDANKTPAGYGMRNRVAWKHEEKQKSIAVMAECMDRRIRALLEGEA